MDGRGPILVAGSSGQLACALAREAARRGAALVAMGRPQLNLLNALSIETALAAMKPTIIINAAAYTAVDRAEAEPEPAFALNRDGAAHLAVAAAERGLPLVHVSTDYVFDGRKASPYCENDATAPLNVYGRSKLEGEQAVLAAHPAAIVARTSWVYSAGGQNFLRTMLRLGETRDVVQVVDDQHGAPTRAHDLADAILDIAGQLTAKAPRPEGGVYHLAAQGETTWFGFAQAIFDGWSALGRRVPKLAAIRTDQYPTAAQRPSNSRLDCSKAARRFGVRMPHWRQSLDLCLDELARDAEPHAC